MMTKKPGFPGFFVWAESANVESENFKQVRDMDDQLAGQPCTSCHDATQALTADEMNLLLQQLTDWALCNKSSEHRLRKRFAFPAYAQALAFTNALAEMAESVNHHPLIELAWGYVRVDWWTHSISGLHRNDFILAARTDLLYTSLHSSLQE